MDQLTAHEAKQLRKQCAYVIARLPDSDEHLEWGERLARSHDDETLLHTAQCLADLVDLYRWARGIDILQRPTWTQQR